MNISADNLPAEYLPGIDEAHEADLASLSRFHGGKSVLVTGAGGGIGSALAKTISESSPRLLVLVDHSEHELYEIHSDLEAVRPKQTAIIPILGDICDDQQLHDIFAGHRPEFVYHLAAFKHVPLGECNPFAVVRNNALGTYKLAMAARTHRAATLTMVSTDKAADPRSLMGVSKRVAELVLLALSSTKTRMNAVRFGNVFGARGSVVPRFLYQISQGGPITITHPDARRYFITLRHAIALTLAACGTSKAGIFIPELREPIRILDLAKSLIERAGHLREKDISIKITALRPGDKLRENLVSTRETAGGSVRPGLCSVKGPAITEEELHAGIVRLGNSLQVSDLGGLLSGLCAMVPEYEPSESLLVSARLLWCATEVI